MGCMVDAHASARPYLCRLLGGAQLSLLPGGTLVTLPLASSCYMTVCFRPAELPSCW